MSIKRKLKSIFAVALVGACLCGATACAEEEKPTTAYEIAVKNGFQGTEEEWLRSLHGENGKDGEDGKDLSAQDLYDIAKENGFTGTFLQFCQTLNITVTPQEEEISVAENLLSTVSIFVRYQKTSGVNNYGAKVGSGVIVDLNTEAGSAVIITNYHVVYGTESAQKGILDEVWVYPYGSFINFSAEEGSKNDDGVRARYLGGAMEYDIAILQVEGSQYIQENPVTEAKIGNSDQVQVGEEVRAIGNAIGKGISVTDGVVSVDSEYLELTSVDETTTTAFRVMRTSAAINGGNSGGGLYNAKGELIGIVNARTVWEPGSTVIDKTPAEDIGYALPITEIKAVYDNILANDGEVRQARLGVYVSLNDCKAVLGEDGRLFLQDQFYVSTAAKDGEASYQKLREGDIFISGKINDGEEFTFVRRYQLTSLLLSVRLGDKVTFVVRNASNQLKEVEILFDDGDYFTVYA